MLASWVSDIRFAVRLFAESAAPLVTIVGVMADVRNDGLQRDVQPAIVVPYTLLAPPQRGLAVRTTGATAPLMKALREQALQLDPQLPLSRPYTGDEVIADQNAQPRFTMALGAQPAQIIRLVGRHGVILVASGLVLGGLASVVLTRLLASQADVFAKATLDLPAFAIVALLLGSAALAACVLPARRASVVPLTEAMR